MVQKIITSLLFFLTLSVQSHIQFINNLNEPLFIVDMQLKKGYSVNAKQEVILLTSAQSSHFLIYHGAEHANTQIPLFSFGTVEHMQKYSILKLTTDELADGALPQGLFYIPSSINRLQASSLINKQPKVCSKCEERRKEREKQREKEQKK